MESKVEFKVKEETGETNIVLNTPNEISLTVDSIESRIICWLKESIKTSSLITITDEVYELIQDKYFENVLQAFERIISRIMTWNAKHKETEAILIKIIGTIIHLVDKHPDDLLVHKLLNNILIFISSTLNEEEKKLFK